MIREQQTFALMVDLPPEQQADILFELAPYLKLKIELHCDLGKYSAKQGLTELLRFLLLVNDQEPLTPSVKVDQIWHQFILCTQLYCQYCSTLYGNYVHHLPSDNHSQEHRQFERCLTLYQQRFGRPEPWFWGGPLSVSVIGSCSGCESN